MTVSSLFFVFDITASSSSEYVNNHYNKLHYPPSIFTDIVSGSPLTGHLLVCHKAVKA